MENITISTEYIKLDQFLKLAGCISTGGSAKALLQEQMVQVNGELEERRGRKLYAGDEIQVQGEGSYKVQSEQ